ncbi:MAG: hypothetical protein JNM84_22310 [Planctomycetes bacterium]|nr:hypothetical protein [Planctomycetota bacterium]
MKRIAAWHFRLLLVLLGASGEPACAQAPFRTEVRGPFRAGEWIALALDAPSVREVREIAVHREGQAAPWVVFRRSAERSEPPAKFPLFLDERGRYEVRCDGRLVQRLALEMQRGVAWPARTWVAPSSVANGRAAWWELSAFSAAYVPEPASAAALDIAERIARARRLPDAPLDLAPIRAAQLVSTPRLGHALGGALLALAVLGLALPRRFRAALWGAGGAVAIAIQLAAPAALWPGRDRLVVWSATRLGEDHFELCADELRWGDGEVALDEHLWLAPLAGGELVSCRAEARGWVVRYRGGIARRWFAPSAALAGTLVRALDARELRFYAGGRYRGRAPAALLWSGSAPTFAFDGAREGPELAAALARIYAAGGEREHAVWSSTAARRFDAWWPWLRAARELFWRAGTRGTGALEVRSPSSTWTAWDELSLSPADPFDAPLAPRFLRLRAEP